MLKLKEENSSLISSTNSSSGVREIEKRYRKAERKNHLCSVMLSNYEKAGEFLVGHRTGAGRERMIVTVTTWRKRHVQNLICSIHCTYSKLLLHDNLNRESHQHQVTKWLTLLLQTWHIYTTWLHVCLEPYQLTISTQILSEIYLINDLC